MFERYNDQARRAVFFARYAASQSGSPKIEAEHLMLGVVREAGSWIARFAPSLSVDNLRARLPRRTWSAENVLHQINMPLTKECRNILSYAAEEATNLNHRYIGAEHLLLAILREEDCMASNLLKEAGIEIESLRQRVATDVSQHETLGAGGTSMPAGRDVVHAMIDELPENMLAFVKEAIDRTVSSVRPIRPLQSGENVTAEGRVSTSRLEGGDVVVETRHVAGGHQIHLTERLHLSPDGTRLSYVQEIAGPKPDQKHKNTIEFDIS